jgi:hypothetical protein
MPMVCGVGSQEDGTGWRHPGDPISGTKWVHSCLRCLSKALGQDGYQVDRMTVRRLLKKQDQPLKANCEERTGPPHPDRDRQFRYIQQVKRLFLAAEQPVISVDTKKKELIGNFKKSRSSLVSPGGGSQCPRFPARCSWSSSALWYLRPQTQQGLRGSWDLSRDFAVRYGTLPPYNNTLFVSSQPRIQDNRIWRCHPNTYPDGLLQCLVAVKQTAGRVPWSGILDGVGLAMPCFHRAIASSATAPASSSHPVPLVLESTIPELPVPSVRCAAARCHGKP